MKTLKIIFLVSIGLWLAFASGCSENPDEIQLKHFKKVTSLLEKNMDSPEDAMKEIRRYFAENREELKAAEKAFKARNQSFDKEDLKEWEKEFDEKFGEDMKKGQEIVEKFRKKHPEHTDEIGRIMAEYF